MSAARSEGMACHRQATSPVTMGVANDVPISRTTDPRPLMRIAGEPMAMTSGFTRPSCEGPTAEKGALPPCGLTAPTVIMSSASAGTQIFFHGPMPVLPALLTSIMPLAASIEAVREISVEWPSSWLRVMLA